MFGPTVIIRTHKLVLHDGFTGRSQAQMIFILGNIFLLGAMLLPLAVVLFQELVREEWKDAERREKLRFIIAMFVVSTYYALWCIPARWVILWLAEVIR